MAEIRYGTLKYLEQQLTDLQREASEIARQGSLVPQEVRQADIAEVVARRARIPLARLLESERERLLKLEARLAQRLRSAACYCGSGQCCTPDADGFAAHQTAGVVLLAQPAWGRQKWPRRWPRRSLMTRRR